MMTQVNLFSTYQLNDPRAFRETLSRMNSVLVDLNTMATELISAHRRRRLKLLRGGAKAKKENVLRFQNAFHALKGFEEDFQRILGGVRPRSSPPPLPPRRRPGGALGGDGAAAVAAKADEFTSIRDRPAVAPPPDVRAHGHAHPPPKHTSSSVSADAVSVGAGDDVAAANTDARKFITQAGRKFWHWAFGRKGEQDPKRASFRDVRTLPVELVGAVFVFFFFGYHVLDSCRTGCTFAFVFLLPIVSQKVRALPAQTLRLQRDHPGL